MPTRLAKKKASPRKIKAKSLKRSAQWTVRRRSGLHDDVLAGAASIFGTADSHHAHAGWHPIQHLTDAFTDAMQGTATAGAFLALDIEHYILALKMRRQGGHAWPACSLP